MEFFDDVPFNIEEFRKDMAERPGARKTYVVFFTPRSGSSWLTDIIKANGKLGRPEEFFNPNFIPNLARKINANSLVNYTKMARRKLHLGGVFSFEITYYQLVRTLGVDKFVEMFPPSTKCFYLIREDIVLQAISLAKAVETSVFHSVNQKDDEIALADKKFSYDGDIILKWLDHIRDQEIKIEIMFGNHSYSPIRISYENIMEAGAERVCNFFAQSIGEPAQSLGNIQTRHRKIGTDKNLEFAQQFRAEYRSVVNAIDAERRPFLNKIVKI